MITYYKNEAYTIKNVAGAKKTQYLIDIACKSTDTKPTVDIVTGSTAIEVNTGKRYIFDEESGDWTEVDSGGGGGGSSDFSTAEMQIVNNTENNFQIDIIIVNDEDGIGMGASCLAGESQTFSVVLYKDIPSSGKYTPESLAGTISGTGSIEIEEEYGDVYVSGDSIITLSENA